MKLENITYRVDELIQLGNDVLLTKKAVYTSIHVDSGKFAEFRAASLSFIMRVFGEDSPNYKEFDAQVTDISVYYTERGIGILRACRSEILGGWLFTTKGLISAELFSDFIEMAEHLLSEQYKDPAAVVVGSVLEEHLRQLCQKNLIPTENTRSDGSIAPLKADTMNSELSKKGVYSKLDQKNITAWLDLRNKAAHGKYSEYTQSQVELMLQSVSNFIIRIPI